MRDIAPIALLATALLSQPLSGQSVSDLSPEVMQFVEVSAPVVALTDVRVVDGTGAAPAEGMTVLIRGDRIEAVGPSGRVDIPDEAEVISLPGHTVIPGLVGMHNHTDYAGAHGRLTLSLSAPRMYLGSGVTTIRTAGSLAPYIELNLKHEIDQGRAPGPHMHIAGPRLSEGLQNYSPTGPEDARRTVRYWAEEGATWFKAHARISRASLAAAIDEAHRLGLKFTGHLCSVTWSEAVDMGIDNLEHGFHVMSDFVPDMEPDECPETQKESLLSVEIGEERVRESIRKLVDNDVAVTVTLPVSEHGMPGRPVEDRVLEMMAPEVREAFLERHHALQDRPPLTTNAAWWQKELDFVRAFVDAGGLLAAGTDPTGNGGAIPGFGDHRHFELLVEAGFTPLEVIEIMTANGARLLGTFDEFGSIEPGKRADLVVLDGNPVERPAEIRNVVIVFKDGVGYDSAALIESVKGLVGAT